MGTLFIVPTPIGNLEDMTLRGIRVLKEVALIAAEDTRTSQVLLQHYDITTPLTSYHEHNKLDKLEALFDALATGDLALISDAGTPGLSDPGYELIQEAIRQGHRVEPLPGANALLPALVAAGLPTDKFTFLGFLPKKPWALHNFLAAHAEHPYTLIAYESPHRLTETLQAIQTVLGERPVCVAREISKKFEEFQRGTVGEVLAYYEAKPPRGELVLLIGGAAGQDEAAWDEARVRHALQERMAAGESLSRASKAVAVEAGWQKRDVYALGTDA